MDLRGIEQMQVAVLPHSQTQMGYIEARLLAGDGNDVTIMNGIA